MVDYTNIEVLDVDSILSVKKNDYLLFDNRKEKCNKKTGEIYYISNYKYNGLRFNFIEDGQGNPIKLFIQGSLHYYHNDGLHNANDFAYIHLLQVIQNLESLFNLDSRNCVLRSLEYGINITPAKYTVNKILQNTFYHQRKKFIEPINKPYKQAGNPKNNDLVVKIYDKRFQYPELADEELLRFETKYCRMRQLNRIGIVSLYDLKSIECHIQLLNLLKQRFKEVLMYDYSMSINQIKGLKLKNLISYSNINYWEDILYNIKNSQLDYKSFNYHKKQLGKITLAYSENIQKKLLEIIDNKGFSLLGLSQFKNVERIKHTLNTQLSSNKKCAPNTPLNIMGFPYIKIYSAKKIIKFKKCIVTGLDISMQKKYSIMLSHTGLKHYHRTDEKIFNELKQKYLSKKWMNTSFNKQIIEIAHGIRHKRCNAQKQQILLYSHHQKQLFNINEYTNFRNITYVS